MLSNLSKIMERNFIYCCKLPSPTESSANIAIWPETTKRVMLCKSPLSSHRWVTDVFVLFLPNHVSNADILMDIKCF